MNVLEKLEENIKGSNKWTTEDKAWVIVKGNELLKYNGKVAFTSEVSANKALTNTFYSCLSYSHKQKFDSLAKSKSKSTFIKDLTLVEVITLEEFITRSVNGVLDFISQ